MLVNDRWLPRPPLLARQRVKRPARRFSYLAGPSLSLPPPPSAKGEARGAGMDLGTSEGASSGDGPIRQGAIEKSGGSPTQGDNQTKSADREDGRQVESPTSGIGRSTDDGRAKVSADTETNRSRAAGDGSQPDAITDNEAQRLHSPPSASDSEMNKSDSDSNSREAAPPISTGSVQLTAVSVVTREDCLVMTNAQLVAELELRGVSMDMPKRKQAYVNALLAAHAAGNFGNGALTTADRWRQGNR